MLNVWSCVNVLKRSNFDDEDDDDDDDDDDKVHHVDDKNE